MALVLNGDGTVTGLAVGGLPDGTVDAGTLATDSVTAAKLEASAITSADLPAGSVLQVVTVQKTDVFSTSSSTLVDVTGLSVSITPSSTSSKILVFASVSGHATDNSAVQLLRDSTIIAGGDASSNRTQSFTGSFYNGNIPGTTLGSGSASWLDSPASTSALTYKVKAGAVGGGTLYLGKNTTDADNAQHVRTAQTITVMEIGA